MQALSIRASGGTGVVKRPPNRSVGTGKGVIMRTVADNFQKIPGVGPSIAQDLRELGMDRVAQLRGRHPQTLNEQRIARWQCQCPIDRCMLYVLRCVMYYAEGGHEPEPLRWWNRKDRGSAD